MMLLGLRQSPMNVSRMPVIKRCLRSARSAKLWPSPKVSNSSCRAASAFAASATAAWCKTTRFLRKHVDTFATSELQ
eukprot:13977866-Alexandrium_andersonii.AAC.1